MPTRTKAVTEAVSEDLPGPISAVLHKIADVLDHLATLHPVAETDRLLGELRALLVHVSDRESDKDDTVLD